MNSENKSLKFQSSSYLKGSVFYRSGAHYRTVQRRAAAVRPGNAPANNPRYLLEPEITLLLAQGFTDLRSRMYFDGLWNIGIKIGNQVVNRGDLSGNSRLQKCLWFPLPRSLSQRIAQTPSTIQDRLYLYAC